MTRFSRYDTSPLSRWWWQVDRWTLGAILLLAMLGMILVVAASPAVAAKIDRDTWFFVKRQSVFLILSMMVILATSFLKPMHISMLSMLGFIGGVILLMSLPAIGITIKGATRWISIFGISMQPSEFVKPFFIITTAWVLSRRFEGIKSGLVSFGLFGLFVGLLIIQPDLGTTILVSAIWGVQLFISGVGIIWLALLGGIGIAGLFIAYQTFPHFQHRIEAFLNPETTENYQLEKSLDAFSNGGFFGAGIGEGTVKTHIPDAHTDFIFAVAGEEFGVLLCLLILGLFAFIVLRSFLRVKEENSKFVVIGVVGLAAQLGLQSFINMSVTLNLLPTKGMTLPFVSYGGSSLVALSFTVGMLLALTKKQYGFRGARLDQ